MRPLLPPAPAAQRRFARSVQEAPRHDRQARVSAGSPRERNFSCAAESCGVTQPTLSAGIKQLEDSLGVLLVNRSSRFHGLTADGERVLEWAKRIVSDTRAMRQEIRSPKTALVGHLTIAAVPTALGMTTQLTTPFREKHPDVRFKQYEERLRGAARRFTRDQALEQRVPIGRSHGGRGIVELRAPDRKEKRER